MMSRVRQDCDHLIKLLLIGDSGVGKTCLLLRFSDDTYTNSFISTIGIDFKVKNVHVDNKWIRMQLWDAAGQERFSTITKAYYRNANGVLFVYDVTDGGSFRNVRNWMRNIDEHALENVNKMLVGNKCDLNEKRVISFAEGQALAREFGIPFVESSAKTAQNVTDAFIQITRSIIQTMEAEKRPEKSAISVSNIIGPEQMSGFNNLEHGKRDGSCC